MARLGKKGLKRLFAKFNRKYFSGAMDTPKLRIVAGKGDIARAEHWGACENGAIEIQGLALNIDRSFVRAILLHEMIHLSIGVNHGHKSKKWRREVRRVSALGALAETL